MADRPDQPTVDEVRAAVRLAVRAPSLHNSQPWRWTYAPGLLDLHADRSRSLPATDPDGRGLLLSCGGALALAVLGFAAQGWLADVERVPDPADADLLARFRFPARRQPTERDRELAAAAGRRHTERRPFALGQPPRDLLDRITGTVTGPGVYAAPIERADQRLDLAVVMSWADRLEMEDPAYRDELTRWVRADAAEAGEGVPPSAVPRLAGEVPRHADVPVREFGLGSPGTQEVAEAMDEQPAFLVVFTGADDAAARLRGGEAYLRLSVEAELLGLASSAMTQALDVPGVRERVRGLMGWTDHPQMIVRVGWPPPGGPAPETPRRPPEAVLTVLG